MMIVNEIKNFVLENQTRNLFVWVSLDLGKLSVCKGVRTASATSKIAISKPSQADGTIIQTQDLLVSAQNDIIVVSASAEPSIKKDTPSHCADSSSNSLPSVTLT